MKHQYYKGWPNKQGVNIPNTWKQKPYEGVLTKSADYLQAEEFMRNHRNPKVARSKRIKNRCVNLKMRRNERLFCRKIGVLI